MNSFKPGITISIPTYNRNSKLRRSIELLIPQLTEDIYINIFDNSSDVPVAETISDLLAVNDKIKVYRNRQNLGVSANVLRCFGECETTWMWLLGDDDPPLPNAIATIIQATIAYSDYGFINFKSHMSRHRSNKVTAIGPNDFIAKIDDFGNVLMISLGLYNLQALQSDLRVSYQLSYCLAPHLVYLFSGVKENCKVLLTDEPVINFELNDTTAEESWSWVSVSMCLPILYEVPIALNKSNKKLLASHIRTHIKPPSSLLSILEQPKYADMAVYDKLFLLRQVFFRSILFNSFSVRILDFFWCDIKIRLQSLSKKKKTESIILRDDRI